MEFRLIFAFFISIFFVFPSRWSTGLDNTDRVIEYVYYTYKQTWNEARNVCHSIGGELAKVDSQQTIDDIKQLALEAYPGENLLSLDFWIGLYYDTNSMRRFAIDCSELTFTSNFDEVYDSKSLCTSLQPTVNFEGASKACDYQSPFLCEVHKEGICSFRYDLMNVSVSSVSEVNDYGVCENHCAFDVECSGTLYVSPSVCYKLPYITSNVRTSALATKSSKFCYTFRKNSSTLTTWEFKEKYPVLNCSIVTTNDSPVTNVLEPSSSSFSTFTISPTTLVMSELMTELQSSTCHCMTSVITAIETVTQLQVSTVQPSSSPCICTASTETKTSLLTITDTTTLTEVFSTTIMSTIIMTSTSTELITLATTLTQTDMSPLTDVQTTTETKSLTATTTLTEVQMSTVEITQQCSTQTHISPVTIQVAATPSCSVPATSETPSVSTQPPSNITQQEAEQMAKEISKNLTIDVKTTSTYIRSLICARDDRKTSQAVGALGIICIVVPMAIIMVSDLRGIRDFLRYLWGLKASKLQTS